MTIATLVTWALLLQTAPARPAGAVAGDVQIREGSPAVRVRVSAIPAPPPEARPEEGIQYYEARPPVSSVLTDARGHYRLANVPPGRYFIVASMLGQATFYPAATEVAEATIVTVAQGATLDGIDLRLQLPLGHRVSGRVTPAPRSGTAETAVLSGLKLQEIIEIPVAADGTFEFGYVPQGTYLLSLFPTPPGMPSHVFEVGDADVTSLEFVRPAVRSVSGRLVVDRGPLPTAILLFSTGREYVPAEIRADGSFTAQLSAARHLIDLGGMPVGYGMASARLGAQNVTEGFSVGGTDVNDLVIAIAAPQRLPRLRGRITAARPPGDLTVEVRGPILGVTRTPVRADGTFEFAALTPGTYTVTVPQLPSAGSRIVVVSGDESEVEIAANR